MNRFCFSDGRFRCRLIRPVVFSMAIVWGALGWSSSGWAQSARDQLQQAISDWREVTKQAVEMGLRFRSSGREESIGYREQYEDAIRRGNELVDQIVPLAMRVLNETEQLDPDLNDLLARIENYLFVQGQYEQAYRLGKKILAKDADHTLAQIMTGRAALLTNRFEEAGTWLEPHGDVIEKLPAAEADLYLNLDKLKKSWDRELEIRAREAEADDLPRVELKTTKGTIVLELFENEAPGSVGNFVSLVENGFYDGTIFHRVLRKFMAQGGGFSDPGEAKKVNYSIFDECFKPEIRHHFRGVISVAKGDAAHTGNSQFFITTVPTPGLDGWHTVFGRVIEGMDVVDRLNETHIVDTDSGREVPVQGVVPDRILSSRVLRKREHEYVPNKTIE